MAKLSILFHGVKSVAGVVLLAMGLDGTLPLGHFLCVTVREVLGVLSVMLAVWWGFDACALDPLKLSEFVLHGLQSFGWLLLMLAGLA